MPIYCAAFKFFNFEGRFIFAHLLSGAVTKSGGFCSMDTMHCCEAVSIDRAFCPHGVLSHAATYTQQYIAQINIQLSLRFTIPMGIAMFMLAL